MSTHGFSDKPLPSAQQAHQQQNDSTSSHPPPGSRDPTISLSQDASQGRLSSAAASSASEQSIALRSKLKNALRQYQDFPSPGILFEDIMPIFADPKLHESLLQALELHISDRYGGADKPDVIVGLEARGFLFGPSLALRIGAAFVPVRKKGKLPGETETTSYKKEYGEDFFQMQKDAIKPGQKVVVVDDIIATGGSAMAAGQLIEKLGGRLLSYLFLLELDFLKGRDKLNAPVYTLLSSQE